MTLQIFSRKGGWGFCFRQAVKSQRGPAAVLFLLFLLGSPFLTFFAMSAAYEGSGRVKNGLLWGYFTDLQYWSGMMLLAPLCIIFAILFSVFLFRYLHHRNESDFYHSLPVSRVALLYGRYLAGLALILAPLFAALLISALVGAAFGAVNGTVLLSLLCMFAVLALLTAAVMALCAFLAVCCAREPVAVLSALGLGVGYPMLMLGLSLLSACLIPGFYPQLNALAATAFSPFAGVFFSLTEMAASPMPGDAAARWSLPPSLLWWAVFTAVLLAASGVLYRRRREAEGNRAPYPLPEFAIRLLLTLAGGVWTAYFLRHVSSPAGFWCGLVVGAFTAFAVTHAVYARGLRPWKREAVLLGAFALVFAILLSVPATGGYGYVGRVPDADAVESVYFTGNATNSAAGAVTVRRWEEDGPAEMIYLRPVLREPETVRLATEFHQKAVDFYNGQPMYYGLDQMGSRYLYHIRYRLKNGRVLERYYNDMRVRVPDSGGDSFTMPMDGVDREILESEEYLRKTNTVFYMQPEDITGVSFSIKQGQDTDDVIKAEPVETSSVAPVNAAASARQAERLLEALRADILSGRAYAVENGPWLTGYARISLHCTAPAVVRPGSELEALLRESGVSVPVVYGRVEYVLSDSGCETWALCREFGWSPSSLPYATR